MCETLQVREGRVPAVIIQTLPVSRSRPLVLVAYNNWGLLQTQLAALEADLEVAQSIVPMSAGARIRYVRKSQSCMV